VRTSEQGSERLHDRMRDEEAEAGIAEEAHLEHAARIRERERASQRAREAGESRERLAQSAPERSDADLAPLDADADLDADASVPVGSGS
jgi:hypothetical protein